MITLYISNIKIRTYGDKKYMILNVVCFLLIIVAIYAVVLVATDTHKNHRSLVLAKSENETTDDIPVKTIEFVKDKSAIKFLIMAFICLACIYSGELSKLFLPIFSKVYYGNLNKLFLGLAKMIIWGFEIFLICLFARRKFNYLSIDDRQRNIKPISLMRTFVIFLIAFIPIISICILLDWNLKIVNDIGEKVESVSISGVVAGYASSLFKIMLAVLIIRYANEAFSRLIKTKVELPWGGLFLMLTFGLIEFFVYKGEFAWFYLVFNLLFGIIYLLSNKRFSTTYWVSYVIYLL